MSIKNLLAWTFVAAVFFAWYSDYRHDIKKLKQLSSTAQGSAYFKRSCDKSGISRMRAVWFLSKYPAAKANVAPRGFGTWLLSDPDVPMYGSAFSNPPPNFDPTFRSRAIDFIGVVLALFVTKRLITWLWTRQVRNIKQGGVS